MAQGPVFLAKARYRQRRLRDGLRVLPIVGAVMWSIPLLWSRGEGGYGNASALMYMFIVWIGLVGLGAVLTWRLVPDEDTPGPEGP